MKINLSILFLCVVISIKAQVSNQADELFATGNFTKAIETYKTLENKELFFSKIAKAYIAIGNYGEGLAYYIKAIETNPENSLYKYEYAKLLTRTKKYDDANILFRDLIKSDSLNPNYHYELGVVLEKQNDSIAFKEFKNAFLLDTTHQKAIFKIAKRHIYKRRFKEAHRLIDVGLKSYTKNLDLISLKAQAYYYQEYYTHSVVWFKKLIDLGETSEFIHEKLSLSYAQNSDYQDAIYHRKEALKYDPNNANAIYVIGSYYERLSDYENAEKYYKKSLFIQDQSWSEEYQQLGTVLNRQKKYEEAIKAFQKSLKEDPLNFMSEFYIIRTKDEFYADLDTKIKMYEDYLKKKGKSPFKIFAERRLKELKEEKFLEKN
ncbi:tetratricopeptide repeat protein [Winogradskyella sp. PE311]|uniref:tetratricopeptide repeat protein n=1 Tax=Winogradskyella sp. PE311 TaxID=3366943 RepID=UPI003980E69E